MLKPQNSAQERSELKDKSRMHVAHTINWHSWKWKCFSHWNFQVLDYCWI